ncbi:hypothetical protein P171DRAFT_123038 [Karstenula rhodostoma CBS 690.94]|uniref:FHA domain-containing protein n=1 Tax=Karstenula rhodostoma CBS 690.94 TaxID=1392251 RepID=A0A9P4U6V1_9PLEO|nr:hypothetical protein P171DRAFT_123038 [Karstenula rhodostoma CBS 690.94]
MAASEAIEITLRCLDKLDEHTIRTFTLRPSTAVQIGRASKNAAKPELMVGPANAFIDSPTISREHAVLTATPPPAACVYVTDKASMHGTMINGNKLEPQKPQRLNNGDVLQFGANVTREQLFYTARQFTFESSLPSYPNGFTVPESSDDEEVEVDEEMSCPPNYGTQTNPLTIDIDDVDEPHLSEKEELDNVPEARAHVGNHDGFDDDELDKHLQDTTISPDASHDAQERSPSPEADDSVFYPEDVSSAYPRRFAFVDDVSSEGEAASIYSSEDEQVSQLDGCTSADSDESQSDGDMELLEQGDDEEDEGEVAAPSPFSVQLKLLEEQNKQRLLMARREQDNQQTASEARGSLSNRPVSPETREGLGGASNTSMNAFRGDSSESGLTAPPGPPAPFVNDGHATLLTTEAGAPKMSDMFFTPSGVFSDSYNRAYLDSMEALPPRPTAPRPMWPSALDYASPFSPPANTSAFPATYPPDFPFSSAMENPWDQPKSSAAAPASGVQTPPPAPSSEFSSPPVRRTEVSIREIVEDITQQPPTPTSVTGGLKRKAEVLDEAVEGFEEDTTPAPQAPAGAATANATAIDAASSSNTAVDQRPKKRPRSRLASAARYLVSGFVGAAGAVALLTSVPNDFYVA